MDCKVVLERRRGSRELAMRIMWCSRVRNLTVFADYWTYAHTGLFLVHIAAAVNFLFGYVQQTKLTTLHVGFWAHVGFRYRSNFLS